MGELEHTEGGLTTLPFLYKGVNNKLLVVVEGEPDKAFWEGLLRPLAAGFYLDWKEVSGIKNVLKYLKENQGCPYICCLDSEYDEIISEHSKLIKNYPNAVLTIRHSFDNYLFCPQALDSFLKAHCCSPELDYLPTIKLYFQVLGDTLKDMVGWECARRINHGNVPRTLQIVGRHSCMEPLHLNQGDWLPDKSAVKAFAAKNGLTSVNIQDLLNKLKNVQWERLLNLHFIMVPLRAFLRACATAGNLKELEVALLSATPKPPQINTKKSYEKGKLPDEHSMYTALYAHSCKSCAAAESCPDYQNLKNSCSLALDAAIRLNTWTELGSPNVEELFQEDKVNSLEQNNQQ